MAKLVITEIQSLDGELQQLAVENWPEFLRLIGQQAVEQAKICQLRKKGKSVRQIANRLSLPKSTVHYSCGKCISQG